MEAAWWPSIADTLASTGAPWPEAAVLMDLRWWDDLSRMNGRDMRPGRPALCRRWAWTEHAARSTMADRPAWADPAKPDQRPPADRQRTSSAPPANLQPAASQSPADLQRTSSFRDESGVMMHPGRQPTASGPPANLQRSASGSPADLQRTSSRPPHARRTQDTDTDTDTGTATDTDTESNQPAGAGQLSLLSGQVEPVKPARPSRAAREVEAAEDLLRRLDAMRLDRHRGGRALSPTTWLPRVRRALARQSPQEVIDGWTWMLRSPEAAWLRAEDARRPGSDYTRDLSTLLAHPEYAERRSWRGLEGAHEHDLEPRGEAPAVQVVTPLMAAREQRERQEEAERQAWIAEQAAAPAVLPWEDIAEPEPPPAPPPPPPAAPVRPLRERLLEDRAAAAEARDGWLAELDAANAAHEQAKVAQAAERRAGGPPFGPAAREVAAAQNRRVVAQQQLDAIALALVHLDARLAVEVA